MQISKSDFFQKIGKKIRSGERLTAGDGLELFRSTDILAIGRMAQEVRERMHGRRAFYAVNLHINPTNICSTRCEFCSFSRDPGAVDAYALTLDEVEQKVRDAVNRFQINEVHIVGGHNPALGLDYYLEMMRRIRHVDGGIFIKAFSAPEIDDLAKRSGVPWTEVLSRLKDAGLNGMPGGGAEIFDPGVRMKICPKKISAEEWLGIHRAAHGLGMKTNATMLYGHIETDEQRVAHLLKLRDLQDETQGFCAFVPLAYHAENNTLGGVRGGSGFLDLKMLSISRLLLDNVPHIKAHGSATDLKFIQVALSFGADDMGGTNLYERVFHEAGSRAPEGLSSADLIRCIRDAGFEPCLVNSSYSPR
jgi:aminodeoxyfutalosine synthase